MIKGFLILLVSLIQVLGHAGSPPISDTAVEDISTLNPNIRWQKTSLVEGDFDDDGHPDFAMIGYEENGLVLAVQTSSGSFGNEQSDLLQFGIGKTVQTAVCSLPVALRVHEKECNSGGVQLAGCRNSKSAKSLSLDDGECDSIHLYWNHEKERMVWWRR